MPPAPSSSEVSLPTWRRVLRHPGLRLPVGFIWIGLSGGVAPLLAAIAPGLPRLAASVLQAVVSLAAYVGFVALFERRRVIELSPRGALGEVSAGLGLGAALIAGTIAILAALGSYRVDSLNPWSAVAPVLALTFVSSVTEELLMRGIVFRIVEELLGTWLALAVSALLFGLLHLANPHASAGAAVAIALEAGVLLAAAYVATRRLWLAMGLHAGWNFTQGGIFGVSVSGLEVKGVLEGSLSGPTWLSGGAFGAEASLVAVVLCTLAGAELLLRARRRGQFFPAPCAKRSAALELA